MWSLISIIKLKKKVIFAVIVAGLSYFVYNHSQKCSYREEDLPELVWWTEFAPQNRRVADCGPVQCLVTKNKTSDRIAAYLFYGSRVNTSDLPLPKTRHSNNGNNSKTPWAIFHEESPKNLAFFLDGRGWSFFELAATFSRFSDLPVTLMYLESERLLTGTEHFLSVREKNNGLVLEGIAPVLYLQSACDTPIDRDKYVEELMKHVQVDSYGLCLNNKTLPENLKRKNSFDVYDPNHLNFVKKYKFIIAIENARCDDYITEKLWTPLIVGSIPIYLGSPSIEDWLPNKKSALLIDKYQTIEDLANHIIELNENDTLYNEYMDHKLKQRITNNLLTKQLSIGKNGIKRHSEDDSYIEAFECMVCNAIHKETETILKQQSNKSIYECETPTNSWKTFWKMGKCQAKAMDHLINKLNRSNYTNEEFEDLYLEYFTNKNCD